MRSISVWYTNTLSCQLSKEIHQQIGELILGDWTCDEGLDELEDVVYVVDGQADARGHVKPADGSSNKHELGVIK